MTQAVAVALGGNLGRPGTAFRDALGRLDRTEGLALVAVSRAWRSAPWGREDQPAFLNAAARFETSLTPRQLLDVLQAEERRAGRQPGPRWGPRTLDLDLLFHGDVVQEGPGLVLPHPHIAERSFVLEPLAEVAPDWRHPLTGATPSDMLAALEASGRGTACVPADVSLPEPVESRTCPS